MNSTNDRFFYLIGLYMVHWSSVELAVDCATVKVLATTPEAVIATTGGKAISEKIKYLSDSVTQGAHPKRAEILELLAKIPSASVRNSIAHSYMRFGTDFVEFIHRKSRTKVKLVKFTKDEFEQHLKEVAELAHQLSLAFAETEQETIDFIAAAERNST